MTPYYDDGTCVIYHGDCRDVMPCLGPVDALVTDPPFGIDWGRATWADDTDAYPALMRWLVEESRRLVPVGWVFVFQAMPNCGRFHEWFPEGWRIFAACKNFAQIRPTGVFHSWDPVVFWQHGPSSRRQSEHVNRDYYVGSVAGLFGHRSEHPSPRPLDTMTHIVQLAAHPGATVLDPFMGSGTTLVAAKSRGIRAIGIECNEAYCEIAAKRLAQGTLDLFREVSA